jgi:hypothetical protein
VVQDVKPLHPELHVKALLEPEMPKQASIQIAVPWSIEGDVPARIAKAMLSLNSIGVGDERHRRERGRIVPVTIVCGSQATELDEWLDQVHGLMVAR